MLTERLGKHPGEPVGLAAKTLIEAVGKECAKLHPEKTALGQKRASLLDQRSEMAQQRRLGHHNGFAHKGAAFGASDIKHIGQTGQIGERHIVCIGRKRVGQTGAVDKEGMPASRHTALMAVSSLSE